jgi:hypothetical protein
MSKTIRAKFNVTSITEYGNDGGRNVKLQAVIGGSEENNDFWKYTPSGSIEIHVSNPDLEIGFGEYYVDFTKAD